MFLVNDNPTTLTALKKALSQATDISVVGTATHTQQAVAAILQLQPNIVCSEASLPERSTLALIQQLMDVYPIPILIIGTAVQDDPALITGLLSAGAVEALATPPLASIFEDDGFIRQLTRKLKVLAGVSVFRRKPQAAVKPSATYAAPRRQKILVLGASTGGPQALEAVLSKLPAHYPLPIVCIQHISKGFLDPFILWLDGKVKLPVSVAKSGEHPEPGRIYFAPDHANLEFDSQGRFAYSHAPEYLHYPSVDVTFHGIAKQYGHLATAVLLTGMGDDGAGGLKAIAQAGGMTIAQDEASCVVFGMPKVAIETGAAQKTLNLEQIAEMLCRT
ncbi:MAG: chemotaxis protein CheB [Methylovulum sp.]|nr:chemotaxis protein CheB [Methylovulum sp.]